jgi:hypothetical protein
MKKELIELMPLLHPENEKHYAFSEDPEQQCQMLQLLLNQKLTSFHFPCRLRSVHQGATADLWHCLLRERPPNLTTIVSKQGSDFRPFVMNMLPKFPKLEVLRLGYFLCKNADLSRFALHLQNLKYVYFSIKSGLMSR